LRQVVVEAHLRNEECLAVGVRAGEENDLAGIGNLVRRGSPERKVIRWLTLLDRRGFLSGIKLLFQALDFALETLDDAFIFLKRVDPLLHYAVLFEQRLGVSFLLGIDLLGV